MESWDTYNAKNMSYMFTYAESFNQNLESKKLSKECKIDSMFYESLLESNPLE